MGLYFRNYEFLSFMILRSTDRSIELENERTFIDKLPILEDSVWSVNYHVQLAS